MSNHAKITNWKPVHIVWSNKDLTEGRGDEFILAVCASETTAKRLAKGKYVMGTDCPIDVGVAYLIAEKWYAFCNIIDPTNDDIEQDKLVQARHELVDRAKALGLTDDDIQALRKL